MPRGQSILKSTESLSLASAPRASAPISHLAEATTTNIEDATWSWWVSHDGGCVYSVECHSFEEALRIAESFPNAIIAECRKQSFSLDIDADDVLDRIADRQVDLRGEGVVGAGGFISSTVDQRKDLSAMLTATVHAWAKKHAIDLTAWCFADIRKKQVVASTEAGGRTSQHKKPRRETLTA